MANQCDIDILICTESEQEANKLEEILNERIKEGWTKNKGVYLGSKDRYFFDVDIERMNDKCNVRLTCWVKWSLNYTEAKDVIDFFRNILDKPYISIRYEEMGFSLYGEYVYDGETLMDTYLDEHDFPVYKEGEDNDTFYDELEDNFKSKGIDVLVHDYTDENTKKNT